MKKYYSFIILLFLITILPLASAAINSIDYPRNNDIISETARIQLNVSSAGSTGCYLTYVTSNGAVPYNQSVVCNGVSLINLPNTEGTYNLTVTDNAASSQTITITVDKPEGILVTAIYILTFIILLSMLFLTILNIAKLATASETIFDVAISISVYFALLIVYQLVIEYSNVPFIINWLDLIRNIGGWIMVMLPLIAFFVTFFKKGTEKRKMPSIQEMTGQPKGIWRYG